MADRERVIKGLQEISDEAYSRWVHQQYTRDKLIIGIGTYVEEAIKLLKAQEPVPPVIKQEMDDVTSCIENIVYCGNCGYKLGRFRVNYCENCGRAVKWE